MQGDLLIVKPEAGSHEQFHVAQVEQMITPEEDSASENNNNQNASLNIKVLFYQKKADGSFSKMRRNSKHALAVISQDDLLVVRFQFASRGGNKLRQPTLQLIENALAVLATTDSQS